jgi:hypothetical protein
MVLQDLLEAKGEFETLKDNKVALTPEERKQCLDQDAVWHHGQNGAPSPAVWKSVNPRSKKVTYVTNTHRAYNTAPTLKGAIRRFHEFIKDTA